MGYFANLSRQYTSKPIYEKKINLKSRFSSLRQPSEISVFNLLVYGR